MTLTIGYSAGMDIDGLNLVAVARWSTGHVLSRAITDTAALMAGHTKLQPRFPSFLLSGPGDVPLYWIRILVPRNRDDPPRMFFVQTLHTAALREDVHRKVLHDAAENVLRVRFPEQQSGGTNKNLYMGSLTATYVHPQRFAMARKAEDELVQIGIQLEQIHPEMVKTKSERKFREDPRKPLNDLRMAYQHTAVTVLGHVAWAIGRMSWMMPLVSSPRSRDLTVTRFERTYNELQGLDLADSDHKWYVALVLHFQPAPLWQVLIVEGSRWGDQPDWNKQVRMLGQASRPLTALMNAGLLLENTKGVYEEWVDAYVADLPEPELRFDFEAYELVDSYPLLKPLDWFRTWLQGAEPRW